MYVADGRDKAGGLVSPVGEQGPADGASAAGSCTVSHPILGPITMFFIWLLLLTAALFSGALPVLHGGAHDILVPVLLRVRRHCWPRYGEGAGSTPGVRALMRMLHDYEAEAMMAKAKGDA